MCHCVYVTKTRGEQDSDCIDFFPHNNPLPYISSSENVIIAGHILAHTLKNPSPQAPFSIIGDSQMVAIKQLSDIFSKVADKLHQRVDPPKQQTVTKSATIPHKVRSTMTKLITSEEPNITEDNDGKSPTSFYQNVLMYPSVTHSIHPEVPVTPPRVQPAQPPRVDTEGPSSNLRSIVKKNNIPNFALAAQFQQVIESNEFTHQIYGVAQE